VQSGAVSKWLGPPARLWLRFDFDFDFDFEMPRLT
jgi:hypothetical protein